MKFAAEEESWRVWKFLESDVFSTQGVNFINMFTPSFYACRSQKCKKLLDLTVFFALLGSERVKAARKTLVKLTPALIYCVKDQK